MKANPPIKILISDKEGMMFEIPSSSRKDVTFITNVFYDNRGWWCNCEDYRFRQKYEEGKPVYECKHIKSAKALMSDCDE